MGACATAVAGGALCSGEERGGRGENGQGRRWDPGRVREGRGAAWRSSRAVQEEPGRQGGRRWPGRGRAGVGHALVLLSDEEDDRRSCGGGLGQLAGPASCGAGPHR